MMAVLDLLQRRVELALEFLGQAGAEDLGDLVSGHPPQTHLAGTLEDFVDREVPLEDEIAAILNLLDGVEAA